MKKLFSGMLGLWLILGAMSLSAAPRHRANKGSHFRTVSSKSKFKKSKYHGKKARRNGRSKNRY